MKPLKLTGLVAATHSPFDRHGALRLAGVEAQARHLLAQGVHAVFICGTTGESHSLTCDERRRLAQRWCEVARGTPLQVVIHVGSNCLSEARALAAQAEQLGAPAVAAFAPSYFKPRSLADLVAWAAQIAAAAPHTPFYYYDIPGMTGVSFPMRAFLDQAADGIPTLNGLKFSNLDLMTYQQCLAADDGAFDILWGVDESLLAALAVGGAGGVGSSYNFAAPLYHRLLAAFAQGDLATARQEQQRSVNLIALVAAHGYLGASKAVMNLLGVDVGPTRPPLNHPSPEQTAKLRAELEKLGFFDWVNARQAAPVAAAK